MEPLARKRCSIARLAAGLIVATSLSWAAAAQGHALAQRTDPGVGAALDRPPEHVSVYFDSQLEPLFSKLTVSDAQGRKISGGNGELVDGNVMIARPSGMGRGTYRVEWDVVSRDGHRSIGSYTFTVR